MNEMKRFVKLEKCYLCAKFHAFTTKPTISLSFEPNCRTNSKCTIHLILLYRRRKKTQYLIKLWLDVIQIWEDAATNQLNYALHFLSIWQRVPLLLLIHLQGKAKWGHTRVILELQQIHINKTRKKNLTSLIIKAIGQHL